MIVSNNSLLNILLPNDNKTLKEALKDADAKTLQEMVKKNSASVNDILKNLFDDLKSGTKTNSNIENVLKNTNLFKDLGSFTKSLTTILNQIDKNSPMAKHIPVLQNFLKNISQMDEQTLKAQLLNSGVFLESKINTSNQKSTLPSSIEKLLNQILELTKNINTPVSKQLNSQIEKLLSQDTNEPAKTMQNLKSLLPLLENLSKSLTNSNTYSLMNLTKQLKDTLNNASFLESKIQNSNSENLTQKQNINNETKNLLQQLKSSLLQTANTPKQLLSQIDSLLIKPDLFAKDTNIEPKALINNLLNQAPIKQLSNSNPTISNIILNLQNLNENISTIETKIQNFTKVEPNEKSMLLSNIKDTISNLKSELQNIKSLDLTNVNKLISKIENLENLFTKVQNPIDTQSTQGSIQTNTQNLNFSSNFSSNISNLLLNLKESILNLSSNNSSNSTNDVKLQSQIQNIVEKIEITLKENLSQNTNTNMLTQGLQKEQTSSNPLANDMKSVLLQMQEELASKTGENKSFQELGKQIDRMITQIDYHQLLSLTSNSNYVYVPFLWDMLEDGSIGMKKVDEDKFYCQINLTLKDYGKVDLMLGLYDKNKIDITIQAQREHFKVKVRDNIKQLKKALNNVDLIPVNIKLLDLKEEDKVKKEKTDTYVNNYDTNSLNTGLDIRV